MNADIQIETVGSYDISQDFYVYNSTLYLKNVTLDTPYTKFKCQINDKFKEISFKVKGKSYRMLKPLKCCNSLRVMNQFKFKEINNEPVFNAIMLKNGTAQNLTCNRWSQFVPVKWFKVNISLSIISLSI